MVKPLQQLNLPSIPDQVRPVGPELTVLSSFARHETFHPRHGWLKKGFQAALDDPFVFSDEDSPTRLGVGKNMARAIRYWCHAFKLLAEDDSSRQRRTAARPTQFGLSLLGPAGWDPFLEDVASLWLLHWQLMQPSSLAPSWYFAFNALSRREFGVDDLVTAILEYGSTQFPTSRIAVSSLRKDVNCLVRMYLPHLALGAVSEETLSCPFAELGLLRQGSDSRSFEFEIGPKATLPASFVVATCLEFVAKLRLPGKTIPLARLLRSPGSPGMVFKLSESALYDAIESVAATEGGVSVADSAGVVQLAIEGAPLEMSTELLERYYETHLVVA